MTTRQNIKEIPSRYREQVQTILSINDFKTKFMMTKGLIGKEGKIEKVTKEIEKIEDYALVKLAQ